MKKLITVLLALLLAPMLSVTALADAAFFDYDTWVEADYYVSVTTPDGGLNFRSEPNLKSDIYALIPDFEILHIISVVDDSWGETTYDGSWGFVFLGQTTEIPPVSDADYYVLVTTPDGGLNLRTGPGSGFGKLVLIPDFEQLRINQVSGEWGKTIFNGSEGWVFLGQTTRIPEASPSELPSAAVTDYAPASADAAETTATNPVGLDEQIQFEQEEEEEDDDDEEQQEEQEDREQSGRPDRLKDIFGTRLLFIGLGIAVIALVTLVIILLINKRATVKK